jgi:hypothetical protein
MTLIERDEEELSTEKATESRSRWNRETGDVRVIVEDSKLGESFVVPAQPERVLQVFHHPYAYAPNLPALKAGA